MSLKICTISWRFPNKKVVPDVFIKKTWNLKIFASICQPLPTLIIHTQLGLGHRATAWWKPSRDRGGPEDQDQVREAWRTSMMIMMMVVPHHELSPGKCQEARGFQPSRVWSWLWKGLVRLLLVWCSSLFSHLSLLHLIIISTSTQIWTLSCKRRWPTASRRENPNFSATWLSPTSYSHLLLPPPTLTSYSNLTL